jgi:hypothetical protein
MTQLKEIENKIHEYVENTSSDLYSELIEFAKTHPEDGDKIIDLYSQVLLLDNHYNRPSVNVGREKFVELAQILPKYSAQGNNFYDSIHYELVSVNFQLFSGGIYRTSSDGIPYNENSGRSIYHYPDMQIYCSLIDTRFLQKRPLGARRKTFIKSFSAPVIRAEKEILHKTSKGMEVVKADLSNVSEKDFIDLYNVWSVRYEKDAVNAYFKERIIPQMANNPKYFDIYSQTVQKHGMTFEDRKKLIEVMNESAAKAPKEGDLKDLKGASLYQSGDYTVEGSFIHKAADLLASQGHISVLYEAIMLAPNTPAARAIKAACTEHFDQRSADIITERFDDIKKVPYKNSIFDLAPNSKNETRVVHMSSNYKEANFLDAFTEKLKEIATKKYGKTDDFYSLSEAAENPEFLEDADELWNKMFEKVEETPLSPNWHNNAFIRKMFPEKAKELHLHTSEPCPFDMDSMIDYLERVGKMSKAIKEYCADNDVYLNGNLHFDLANAGVDNFKDAKRCLDIWCAANGRPDRYGSPYNNYGIDDIVQIAKTPVEEAWMYPVMMNAVRKGGFSISDRAPSERTLFDACKAWKICPSMPQRLAEKVGKHSLYGRMLAGAIFEQMTEKGQTSSQEWKDNKYLHEQFFKELSTAEKMDRVKALQHYVPDNTVNRKRLAGAILEESGKEPTKENFVGLYRDMKNRDAFSTILAQNTPNTPLLRVEIARKNAEVEAEEASHDYKKSLLETKKKLYRKQVKTTSPVKKVEVKKSEKPAQQSSLDANIKPVKGKDQR